MINYKLVTSVEEAIQWTVAAIVPGHFLINVIPACKCAAFSLRHFLALFFAVAESNRGRSFSLVVKYLPSWSPFAGDKEIAARWGETIRRVFSIPFEYVKDQMVCGCFRFRPCLPAVTL